MLMIKALNIHMFRFYKHRELSFVTENDEITSCVLITGGNGKGKTTIVDAIEWCLTGNVQHLNIPYAVRIKGDKLASHCIGLLRNNECKKQEETWVEIVFKEDEIETTIRRCTTSNEFGSENTSLFITQAGKTLGADIAHQWLTKRFCSGERPLEDFFYKYYICNLQKVEDFRCKGRSQMTEEFADFTLQHSEAKQVLVNLERLQVQLNTQIEELQKMKTDEQVIKTLEQEQQKLKENASIPEYIQRLSYPEECLDVDRLSPEEQKEQLDKLVSGGFHTASEWLKELVSIQRKLTVRVEFEAHRDVIQQAIQKKVYDTNTLLTIEEQYRKATEQLQALNDKTLEQAGKFVSELECIEMTQDEWEVRWKEYCDLNTTWRKTDSTLEDCKKGDELLTVFSRLVGVRSQIDDYRKKHKKCPLCGAEEPFVSEPVEQLVKEAENYVRAHDDKKLELAKQVKDEKQIWTDCQSRILKDLEIALNAVINRLTDELAADKLIAETAKLFFTQITELGLKPEQFIDTDTLDKYDDFAEIDLGMIQKEQETIRGLLNFLGYTDCDKITTDPETLLEQIKPLGNNASSLFDFVEVDIRNKVLSLRMCISNRHLADLTRDIDCKRKQNGKLNNQIEEKTLIYDNVKFRADELRGKLNKMKNEEVEGVAPYLFRIFSKLVKHSTLDGFQLQGNEAKAKDIKMMFMDKKNTPILNIISDGQLGAFMLSYLFGNAFRRRDTGKFHCYFVDDITNSMDDINLVSFIDLIKYQLASSRNVYSGYSAIHQFFFSTCDGNLKRLFKYKMDGFEIPVKLIDLDIM